MASAPNSTNDRSEYGYHEMENVVLSQAISDPPATKKYYHLRPGHGGVFKLPMQWHNLDGTAANITAIGTHGCFTCICVWIPLNEDGLCFAAHMAAWQDDLYIDENGDFQGQEVNWAPQDSHFLRNLKGRFRAKFEAVCPEIVKNGIPEKLRKQAIIVCPRRIFHGEQSAAWHIIELVKEIFNLDDSCFKPGQGFIVEPLMQPENPTMLWWRQADGTRVDRSWEQYDEVDKQIEERRAFEHQGRLNEAPKIHYPQNEIPETYGYLACNERQWNLRCREGDWKWMAGEYP